MFTELDARQNREQEGSAISVTLPTRSAIVISDPAKAALLDISGKSGGRIIRAKKDGFLSRTLTVGGAIGAIYGFITLAPVISIAGVAFLGFYFWGEIRHGMSPQKSQKLSLAMSEKIPGQPSINDLRSDLQNKYPVDAVNRAIEEIWHHCKWIRFAPGDPHPLAVYREVYCYQDPHDEYSVMTPVEALITKFAMWGVKELPPKEPKQKKGRGSGAFFGSRSDRAQLPPAPSAPESHSFDPVSPTVVVGSDTRLNAVEVKAETVDHFDDPWTSDEVAEEVELAKKEEAKATPLTPPVEATSPQRQKAETFVEHISKMKPPVSYLYNNRMAKAWNADEMAMFFPQKTAQQWSNAFTNVAAHLPGYAWEPNKKMLIKL